jgi:hypothetical protein
VDYRTFWITAASDAPRVISGPDLIVPGREGFWRVCTVRHRESQDGEQSVSDSLVIARADRERGVCAMPESITGDESEARCSSEGETKVTFAGPAAIGVQSNAEYNCGAHPDGAAQVVLRRLDGDTIAFGTALTAAERGRWYDRALAAGTKQFADFGIFDNWTMEDGLAHLSLEDAIGIERAAGRWQAVGIVSCTPHVACGAGSFHFSIPGFVLPRRLTGRDALRPTLAVIAARNPRASDAFSSPSGDVVAVVDADTLRVFVPNGAHLGSPVMSMPFDGNVVMIEWATGRFVSQWSRQLAPIFATR